MIIFSVDIETGGLSESADILTVGIARFTEYGMFLGSSHYNLYQPGYENSPGAMAVNHIDIKEHAKYKDQFEDNVREIFSLLNYSFIIGHNVDFDLKRLKRLYASLNACLTPAGRFDTLKAMRNDPNIDKSRNLKLKTQMDAHGITEEQIINLMSKDHGVSYHNAEFDAIGAGLLAFKCGYFPMDLAAMRGEEQAKSYNIEERIHE